MNKMKHLKKINLITVCTNVYPMLYVHKLVNRFMQLTDLDVSAYCITDRPNEIPANCKPIAADSDSKGWWNKMSMFSPAMPEGWNVYLDLDTVLLNKFDEEIEWVISKRPNIACVGDAIGWMNCRFNSSLMIFETGSQESIYYKYQDLKSELQDRPGGDQVWMGNYVEDVLYIDDYFKNLKLNLKYHISHGFDNNDKLILPTAIPDNIKIIDCSGNPKPHQLESVPYIKKNWHDVSINM